MAMGLSPCEFACAAKMLVSLNHVVGLAYHHVQGDVLPFLVARTSLPSHCQVLGLIFVSSRPITALQAIVEHAAQQILILQRHMVTNTV